MEEKDIITRKYLSDGERFADIINAGIFHGKPVLKGQGEYAIHVLDVRRFRESEKLQTDARLVFGFLQRQNREEKLQEYIKENQEEFSTMDEEAYNMINAWSRSRDPFPLKKEYIREDGRVNLCKALEDMKATERREGRAEGQEKLNSLYQKLKSQGRMDDVLRAIDDADYRSHLFEEELALEK